MATRAWDGGSLDAVARKEWRSVMRDSAVALWWFKSSGDSVGSSVSSVGVVAWAESSGDTACSSEFSLDMVCCSESVIDMFARFDSREAMGCWSSEFEEDMFD